MRTRWTVEIRKIGAVRDVHLEVDTDDPAVVEAIEQAADRAGVELLRVIEPPGEGEP